MVTSSRPEIVSGRRADLFLGLEPFFRKPFAALSVRSGTRPALLRLDCTKGTTPMTTDHHADRKWSAEVTEHSDALDLEQDVFKLNDPKKIARSLKASAEKSRRRKTTPYRSAMSMLTFYINRAGKNLSAEELETLEAAKDELRAAFGR
jgi:hypothetical protein